MGLSGLSALLATSRRDVIKGGRRIAVCMTQISAHLTLQTSPWGLTVMVKDHLTLDMSYSLLVWLLASHSRS